MFWPHRVAVKKKPATLHSMMPVGHSVTATTLTAHHPRTQTRWPTRRLAQPSFFSTTIFSDRAKMRPICCFFFSCSTTFFLFLGLILNTAYIINIKMSVLAICREMINLGKRSQVHNQGDVNMKPVLIVCIHLTTYTAYIFVIYTYILIGQVQDSTSVRAQF